LESNSKEFDEIKRITIGKKCQLDAKLFLVKTYK